MRLRRPGGPEWLGALAPAVRMLVVFVALADGVLSLELWSLRHDAARSTALAVLSVVAPVRPLAAIALAAAGLYLASRPKREFHRIVLVLAAGAALLAVASGRPALLTVAVVDGLAAMLAESLWYERGDPLSGRLGWTMLAVAVALAAVSGWILLTQHHAAHEAPRFTLPLVMAFAAAVSGIALLGRSSAMPTMPDPRPPLPVYLSAARTSVAPFALTRDKLRLWAGDGRSFVAYGCRAGVSLALGPPIGEPNSVADLAGRFRTLCRVRGWRPAFYQLPEAAAADLTATRRLMIGSEALVELDRFSLQGRAMANLRHQVTRARRLGTTVRVLPEPFVPWDVLTAMRRLAEELASRSRLGEMSFSVGRWGDPAEVPRTVGVAFDGDRRLAAYVTWLWLPAAATVVLDEVKRSPDAPPGAVELLIATCLEQFRGRGERASLGLAPLVGPAQAASLVAMERFIWTALQRCGVPSGLYVFKAKFNPVWEPRYLVVERLVDLPFVLLATLLLHYPGLASRYLARWRIASQRPL